MFRQKTGSLFATTLTLLALSGAGYSIAAAQYPGIYIADTANRWQVASGQNKDDLMGYVICDGGYIGSPLIPNDKKIVDQFLNNCKLNKRIAIGQIPVIDVEANHNPETKGYKAYSANFNGQTFNVCHGYLNSTAWCSAEAEKKALSYLDNLNNKKTPAPQIVQESSVQHPQAQTINRQELVSEVANEISKTLNPQVASNYAPQPVASVPQEAPKQAIQVSKEEVEALQRGELKIEQLLANNRPIVTLDANNQPQAMPQQMALEPQPQMQAQPAELVRQLQEGKLSIQDFVRLTGAEVSLQNGQVANANSGAAYPLPLQAIPFTPQAINPQAMPPLVAQPQPVMANTQDIIVQQQQLIAQQQQMIEQQQRLIAVPAINNNPAVAIPQYVPTETYNYNQQMPAEAYQGQAYYWPEPAAPADYYQGYAYNGVPTSYASTAVYGTHSNMLYPAGAPAYWSY